MFNGISIVRRNILNNSEEIWLFSWLVGFYGMSTIVGYLIPNPFSTYEQSYFKQFSLA